jgi:hypothetical protein
MKRFLSLHDTRPAPAAAGMLISEGGQRELVEANVPDLGYRATPVLPELGGKACEKPPRSDLRWSRLDPRSSPPEVVVHCSSRRTSPPSRVFPPPSGAGKRK